MQDVECRQPHGQKVPIISLTQPAEPRRDPDALRTALKCSASALKADGVRFALGGGYALWAHGGPEPNHDVDLVVTEDDVPAAVQSLQGAGFDIERPPEDWLFKARRGDAMVDVLHRLSGLPVTAETLACAKEMEIIGLRILVLPATDIVIAKLLALGEHYCDFARLLPVIRAVREQLNWEQVRQRCAGQPYAEAFLFLVNRLGIAPA